MKKILLFVVSVLVAATMFAQGAAKDESSAWVKMQGWNVALAQLRNGVHLPILLPPI